MYAQPPCRTSSASCTVLAPFLHLTAAATLSTLVTWLTWSARAMPGWRASVVLSSTFRKALSGFLSSKRVSDNSTPCNTAAPCLCLITSAASERRSLASCQVNIHQTTMSCTELQHCVSVIDECSVRVIGCTLTLAWFRWFRRLNAQQILARRSFACMHKLSLSHASSAHHDHLILS